MTVIDTAAEVAVDKSGFTEAQRLPLSRVFQTLSYNSGTKELTLSDGNVVNLTNLELQIGQISGLELKYGSANQFTILPGAAKDIFYSHDIHLNSAWSKTLTSWSSGSGGGCLDSGVAESNTTYFVYIYYDDVNDVSDIVLSKSTSPAAVGTFTTYQLIGALRTYPFSTDIAKYSIITWHELYAYYYDLPSYNGVFGHSLNYDYIENDYFDYDSGTGIFSFKNIKCRDFTNRLNLVLWNEYKAAGSSYTYYTKTDDIYAEGFGNGIFRIAKATLTNYYIFIIGKSDARTIDLFIDITETPTLPSGYYYYRLIGYGSTDNSGTLTIRKISDKTLGEFYAHNKTIALNISTADKYHAVHSSDIGINYLVGFNFSQGRNVDANITSEANTGGKLRVVCSSAHGLTTGDIVVLTNMNDLAHNAPTRVSFDGTNPTTEFICDDITYIAGAGASAGIVDEPAYLKAMAGAEGYYKASFNVNGTASLNKNWKFELFKNTTELNNIVAERNSTNTLGAVNDDGIVYMEVGDIIWLAGKNSTDTTDISIKNMNVILHKI